MTYGCISRKDRSQLKMYETGVLVNGEKYERLLRERLQCEMLRHQVDLFLHGNAPFHRASGDFFGGKHSGIGLIRKQSRYQPPRKCMVYSEAESRANVLQVQVYLVRKILLAWESVTTPEYCEKLVISMRDRIAEVIKNRGGPFKI